LVENRPTTLLRRSLQNLGLLSTEKISILLIEDNKADAVMVQVYLRDIKNYEFELHQAERLETGKEMMRERAFDIVMLDLSLPDSMGMETLSSFLSDFPNSAVIVFTGLADTTTGLEAVRLGAYDYLVKGDMNPSVLSKSILYASVKKSNQGLAKATQLAEETARMKERFLAHMSHELRTPLNVVIGMSQLLRNEIDQAKRNEYLDSLSKSARDLLQLINNVLDFSKIESGKMIVENRHFHLGQMLKDLITVFKFKAEEKGLKLIGDFTLGEKQIIVGDSYRLKQVLTNLKDIRQLRPGYRKHCKTLWWYGSRPNHLQRNCRFTGWRTRGF